MTQTRLKEIQETAQHVVTAVAAALGVEVAIIDRACQLIATSRTFLEKRGTDINQYFMSRVFETEFFVLAEPGFHEFCAGCRNEGRCPETAEVIRTIRYAGEITGAMLMIAYTEEQKKKLLGNTFALMEFLGEMIGLICSKIHENEMLEREKILSRHLDTTINLIDKGIITVDHKGRISQINRQASLMLKLNGKACSGLQLQHHLSVEGFDVLMKKGKPLKRREIISSSPKKIHCLLSANPVRVDSQIVGAVIFMEDIKDVRQVVYEFSEKQIEYTFDDIIGESRELSEIKEYAEKISLSDSTVLIQCESGTGKELFARAIHSHSKRRARPFITINCAAIPESLLESEFFGYEEGAFTGARKGGKPGKLELADTGTIFLDEIGEMPLHMQAKLLRMLQEKTIERVGGVKSISIDVRIIAATNKDLEQMVKDKSFRSDLYYRLNVVPLAIPPLRKRKTDISVLARYFLKIYNQKIGKEVLDFSRTTLLLMQSYSWPGNVRELENAVEYAMNVEESQILKPASLPKKITMAAQWDGKPKPLHVRLSRYEKKLIHEALTTHGNGIEGKKAAAKELGISLATLYRKMGKPGAPPH